ncbi:hypothetical protein OCAE111667_01330 [Occultella aeris]|uniref:Uncharacterized protein n=1 Tax=Occultella aeris TaxID=2761496 RepID=A0A7M4DT64_9MICO|nr:MULTISPECIES: hypothetical protein [Occultella]VZO40658.1 hypothetical protein HALOF300_05366 [Occultella aeris]
MSTPGPPREDAPPRMARSRKLWHLGMQQMIVTVVIIIVLNVVARRLGLGWGGSIAMCAAIAFSWPFVAAWWNGRRRK